MEVLGAQLGPHHPRTLVAARNLQLVKHKMLKLPVEAGLLLGEDEGTRRGLGGSGWEGGAGGGGGGGGVQGGKRRSEGRVTVNDDSSGSEDWEKVGAARSIAGKSVKSKGGKRKGGSKAADKADSPKERLTAVMETRRRNSGAGSGISVGPRGNSSSGGNNRAQSSSIGTAQQGLRGKRCAGKPGQEREKEITDLDYLGGGMFQAGREARALYEACRADIEAHAKGARCSIDDGMEVLEVQVSVQRKNIPPFIWL